MKINEILLESTKTLSDVKIASARLDAELIISHILKKDRLWLIKNSKTIITKSQIAKIRLAIKKRLSHIPLAYILKYKEFYGVNFEVNSDVLIPRVETEGLVELAINLLPPKARLLEIGTGSGAIAIALRINRPDIKLTVTDKSKLALKVSKKNAQKLLPKVEIDFVHSDMFENISSKYDAIIANLPYVPKNIKNRLQKDIDYEPANAIFGGKNGLKYYSIFFEKINKHLNKKSLIFIESDHFQQEAIIEMAKKNNLNLYKKTYWHLVFAS